MPQDNGRNRWLLWTAGIIMTFVLTALTFLGSNVVANDKSSRNRDDSIKIEGVAQERRLGAKLDTIQTSVTNNHTVVLLAVQQIQSDIKNYHDNN